MGHVFISHAEEDADVASELAALLKGAGHPAWHYEQDNRLSDNYQVRIARAIQEAEAFILILSEDSFRSHYVDKEVSLAINCDKRFIPLLNGVKHERIQSERPGWFLGMCATVSLSIPNRDASKVVGEVVACLENPNSDGASSAGDVPRGLASLRQRRRGINWRVVAVAALCLLAALVLALWVLMPSSSQVKFDKPAKLFAVSHDGGEEFVYTFHVEVENYGPEKYQIEDIRPRVETSDAPNFPSHRFDPDGFACYDAKAGGEAAQVHEYVVKPLRETLELKCVANVKVKPDEGDAARKKEALLRTDTIQSLTASFIGKDDTVIEELRFCFRLTGVWPYSTRYTIC